ncbi:arsenate reductase ArsC [Paraburkholderia fungorum]|uniref:arsenate reductase ArsC n=1 Tax=Paraburkholderia fungorum TaxID=134537 RepID=UPI0036F27A28
MLFLSTGNQARSILAEATLNAIAGERFTAFSAGSFPGPAPAPFALDLLRSSGISTGGLRSKGWDEFAEEGAPKIDFIFTVCDDVAGEVCPIWPGHPANAHWGVPDPVTVQGEEDGRRLAFRHAYVQLRKRIELFINLPFEKLDRLAVHSKCRPLARHCVRKGSNDGR